MKKFLKMFGITFFALCYLFAVSACGAGYGDKGGGYGAYGDAAAGGETGSDDATDDDIIDDSGTDSEKEDVVQKPAGLITAGAWNDNDNYQDWLDLFMQAEEEKGKAGKFFEYSKGEKAWGFNSCQRVKVTVKQGGKVVAGAKVYLKDALNNVVFEAVADANGVAYLFSDLERGKIEAFGGNAAAAVDFTSENKDVTVDIGALAYAEKKNIIELMFVVDVTGSMGDELGFLNNEIADVVNQVALADSETQINLALLFYRDYSDKEDFVYYDFVDVTTEEGLEIQQKAIAAQNASGGGDYPEAVEDALSQAVSKQWSNGATTKILFQILDAPPHSGEINRRNFNAAVMEATKKGIRICPVLCSGAEILTEYVMRQAAIYTGGTFVFVTDDSGIGNPHHDPQLPNVTVEALNSLMVRLINGYHSGEFAEPIDWRQEVKEDEDTKA